MAMITVIVIQTRTTVENGVAHMWDHNSEAKQAKLNL
jgi:Flp pilus assembly pilin Flp